MTSKKRNPKLGILSRRFPLCLWFAVLLPLSAGGGEDKAPKPYMVCLDFESAFDKGALGRQVGVMFRAKAHRKGVYTVDAEYEWEGLSEAMKSPALDTAPAAVAAEAKKTLDCDVLIWGEIEKPGPTDRITREHKTAGGKLSHTTTTRTGTRLLLHVWAIDLRETPPVYAVRETFDLASNYEISPAVEEVLKMLTGAPTTADLEAAKVKHRMNPVGPNLIEHGDLDNLLEGPATDNWMSVLKTWHFPMKKGIYLDQSNVVLSTPEGERVDEVFEGALRYTLDKSVAGTTGLFCFTPYVAIKPETYYQASVRILTRAPSVIVWVKGYRDMEVPGLKDAEGKPVIHRQEVYRHQKRFYGKKGEWGTLTTEPFLPRSEKPEHMPQFVRIQLYAYWPAGEVFFDNVTLRECREAVGGETPQDQKDATE